MSRRSIGFTPFPRAWVNGRRALHHRPRYGFRLKIFHLTADQRLRDPAAYLAALSGEGWKIIHLTRCNLLRQALSNLRLNKTGKALFGYSDRLQQDKIAVDSAWVIKQMQLRMVLLEQERAVLASLPRLSLTYEEDLEDERQHQAAADKAFAYLDLPTVAVETRLARIHPGALSDIIANYEEVRGDLAGTPFARYLAEGSAESPRFLDRQPDLPDLQ